jgi:hypothetical protein
MAFATAPIEGEWACSSLQSIINENGINVSGVHFLFKKVA